jgi:hypothetical protein
MILRGAPPSRIRWNRSAKDRLTTYIVTTTAVWLSTMSYDISFQRGFETAFETLDSETTSQFQKKVNRVANSE